ncbi:pantoate--beta-alanine ligase [Aquibacillus sediminis]|uniref:pantoate--beta-alanine ligase n=1 Tax=Aquibacillus sediminis TaxID=2574734 RepID=UPI001108C70A|nr:pantoate--beta-alanine ligase [Aquibacillus sediminis]
MKIIESVQEMQAYALACKKQGKSVGFVPTMGYLHEGHEALMKQARKENDLVVISIFVNPLQFGANEDYDDYPRDERRDIQVCRKNQMDVVFLPKVGDMYASSQTIALHVEKRTNVLCGRTRVGHFNGVVTVLAKLFNITLPDYVYFGIKDAQQVAVVDSLVKDLNYPISIVPVPTKREADGLAKSSRNVYLSNQEREEAAQLYQALQFGRTLVKDGQTKPAIIVSEVKNFIRQHTNGQIEYVELLNYPSLHTTEEIDQQVILALAVTFTKARLIDNIIFDENGMIQNLIL